MNIQHLDINAIRSDGGTQARVQLDWIAIDEYSKAMQEGAQFPPIVTFHDGKDYWLADGFHRLDAAKRAGIEKIACDVRMGTVRDAILHAVGANADHGVRRTNADKRAAVMRLLEDDEWGQWSDSEIARRCKVNQSTVWRIKNSLMQSISEKSAEVKYVNKHGTVSTMNTANIGNGASQAEVDDSPTIFDIDDRIVNDAGSYRNLNNGVKECEQCGQLWAADLDYCPYCHISQEARVHYVTHEAKRHQAVALESKPKIELPINIISGDSSKHFAEYVTEPVHLIVTSPPYNVGIDYDIAIDDLSTYTELITATWRQCYSVMEEGARICVVVPFGVGRNPWTPIAGPVMETLCEAGFTLRGQIIWDKNTTGNRTTWGSFRLPSNPSLRDTTECVIVAQKGGGTLDIPADRKFKDSKGTFSEWLSDSDYFMELAQDHWVVAPESAQRVGHPAPFPPELVRRLAHFYGYPGMHIADPFGGSGTVAVIAKELECQATLMDISAEYCEKAENRIGR